VRCLPARYVAVADEDRQPVGGGVHRRRQARGPSADDRQVVLGARGRVVHRPALDDPLNGRALEQALLVDEHRQLRRRTVLGQDLLRLRRPVLEPQVGLGDARQEVTQAVALGVEPLPDHRHLGADGAHVLILSNRSTTARRRCRRRS
jgi:hypothetical protein